MNILFISKYATPPKFAKSSSRPFSLCGEFQKLGNNVTIITSDSNHFAIFPTTKKIFNFDSQNNVPFIWIRTLKYKKTASIKRILSWFDFEIKLFLFNINKVKQPDVVIISSLSIFTIIYGYYLKKKFGCFLVFEIRDIWPLTMTEEAKFSKWHPLVLIIKYIEKFGYNKADLVVGTMPRLDIHIKNVIKQVKPFHCSPLGFDPNNYVIENNLHNTHFNSLIPQNKFVVGYAGSLGITNALEPFINTIKLMRENNKIHFVIVGGGDYKEKYVKDLNFCSNVSFIDRIEQKDVKYFLQMCDILYLSTKNSKVWEYGQSMNKVVEYMLAGKPILANYSGYPSMINESNCGYFINSRDPVEIKNLIIELSSLSKYDRIILGQNGIKWMYSNRTYSILAKLYLEAIDLTIRNKKYLILILITFKFST